MARRREGEPPLWLGLPMQPGVIEVLHLLSHHGPLESARLGARVEARAAGAVTLRAVRALAACGLLRRDDGAGSWDDVGPDTRYALTERGHGYAEAIAELGRWATRRLRVGPSQEHRR